jgi:hypothetical protein
MSNKKQIQISEAKIFQNDDINILDEYKLLSECFKSNKVFKSFENPLTLEELKNTIEEKLNQIKHN